MKRSSSILCVLIFVVGVLIVPAVHAIHSCPCEHTDNHTSTHDSERCSICAIAATALIAERVDPTAWMQMQSFDVISLSHLCFARHLILDTSPARAPPVA